MRIECKTTFLDGKDRFEAGDVRSVEDERGRAFISAGWAAELGTEPQSVANGPADLVIHASVMGTGDSNG